MKSVHLVQKTSPFSINEHNNTSGGDGFSSCFGFFSTFGFSKVPIEPDFPPPLFFVHVTTTGPDSALKHLSSTAAPSAAAAAEHLATRTLRLSPPETTRTLRKLAEKGSRRWRGIRGLRDKVLVVGMVWALVIGMSWAVRKAE